MNQRTLNWIFGIAAGLAIIIGLIAIFSPAKGGTSPGPNGQPQKGGIGSAIANAISNVFSSEWWKNLAGGACDPNKVGYTKNGQYNPSKCGYLTVNCDPNRPGYELDGSINPNCGKSYEGCDPTKCDPNREGWNQCGIPDINCGFGG